MARPNSMTADEKAEARLTATATALDSLCITLITNRPYMPVALYETLRVQVLAAVQAACS
jgi:hypothetical protein